MRIASPADAQASDHKMLRPGGQVTTSHWLIDIGWLGLLQDESLRQGANSAQCVGSKAPVLVDGNVVIERCGRALAIPSSWTPVAEVSAPLYLLCWQHGSQYMDFVHMYETLRAGE